MPITGPSFIALQVADLERAAAFYETRLGLRRAAVSPPHAVVFDTRPIALAVREPMPGFDPQAVTPWAGAGTVLWLESDDATALHDALAESGVEIASAPAPSPFGPMFVLVDPDGYRITVHGPAPQR